MRERDSRSAASRATWALSIGWLLLAACGAGAEEPVEARNRVSFVVESTLEVDNDRVRAVLVASAEAVDPAECAASVNGAMGWALERARGRERLSVQTGTYNTHPVYDDGRIRRWRARQQLVLAGEDTEAIVALVGELQARLALESFVFSISDARRREVEDELIAQALAAMRARADLVRRGLGARAWRLDEVSIDTGGGVVRPLMLQARSESLASRSAAPPAVEGGTTRLQVRASATIVLE